VNRLRLAFRPSHWVVPDAQVILSVVWLAALVFGGVIARHITGYSPDSSSFIPLQAPSWHHPFGTDDLGRDVLVRVAAAGGRSVAVGGLAVIAGLGVGLPVGALAAVHARFGGELILRATDILLAFPAIILALVISLMIGKGFWSVILIIGIVLVPQFIRLVRARVETELRREYVLAERAAGASALRILGYHVSRNVAPPLLAYALVATADAMVLEATLSFIGVGIQPPAASWGNILFEAHDVLDAWWLSLFPALALVTTVLLLSSFAERRLRLFRAELPRVAV
jgi:peptide/nickel transport system permease protein